MASNATNKGRCRTTVEVKLEDVLDLVIRLYDLDIEDDDMLQILAGMVDGELTDREIEEVAAHYDDKDSVVDLLDGWRDDYILADNTESNNVDLDVS
jgi:hypothetical protein